MSSVAACFVAAESVVPPGQSTPAPSVPVPNGTHTLEKILDESSPEHNGEWPVTINSFTHVCYFHTFENNLRTERKFTKYLKESCSLASDKHFSFKCFPENAFVSNIFSNVSGLFWLL